MKQGNYRMLWLWLLGLFLMGFFTPVRSQELNCRVQVLVSPKIQMTEKRVFESLETALNEFLNNNVWSEEKVRAEERIRCTMVLNITAMPSPTEFEGTATIQSSRPVYGTSYSTPLMNYADQDFQFTYLEFEPLEYTDNQHRSNLTSLMAFYAYYIIGLDLDSYGLGAGAPYFAKAMNVVNAAQQAKEGGWKAFENTRNRYWLAENQTNPAFKVLHQTFYDYHRKGLDQMFEKKNQGVKEAFSALQGLSELVKNKPGSPALQQFFTVKSHELTQLFSDGPSELRAEASNLLIQLDPVNAQRYSEINK